MRNAHIDNFNEALVFADECDHDTTRLRANAEKIIGEMLMMHADDVARCDSEDFDGVEGGAAFHVGIAATLSDHDETLTDFPELLAFAARIKKEYAA